MKLLIKLLLLAQVCFCTTMYAQTATPLPAIGSFIKPAATRHAGVFNVYVQDAKYYLEVPDSLLKRDILAMIVINRGSAQLARDPRRRYGFAGDVVHETIFRFSKNKRGGINMEQPQFYNAPGAKSSYYATLQNKAVPIILSFTPVAQSKDALLIDVTTALNSDMPLLSLSGAKEELGLGAYQANLSSPLSVSSYKNNLVFRSTRAYGPGVAAQKPASLAPGEPQQAEEADKQVNGPTAWEVGASWYLLPAKPMRQRIADKRVGFFTRAIKDYTQDPSKADDIILTARWKLEPKTADIKKYNRGELVEPAKPIVFYVDKNTPAYLQPYFIAGVNAWQKSFEKIGFKNAITAKMEPDSTQDPEFSMDNANYSVISYKPSTTANAYGPMVVDPRSGEILSSHVAVFHNITDLLQRWYFVMCSTNDPRARKLPLSQDIMGRLAQTVITHEVGHTLGLRHDFAGSHSYDVDSVRKRSYVAKNGFGASIMDYLRFNYVAQPEDGFTADELLPQIGVYDDYAIEWGYKYLPQYKTPADEAEKLKQWVSEKRKDSRLFYFPEGDFYDPRVQSEDMGNNAMKAAALGINNLKLIMSNLESWLEKDDDENYTMLKKMHTAVASRYNEYLGHVLKNIGGHYADQALIAEGKPNYIPVSRQTHKEAMDFLNKYFFQEPSWMFPQNITNKTRFVFAGQVEGDYEVFMARIFFKFSAISRNERIQGYQAYTAAEYFDDIYNGIFLDLNDNKPISSYRRMLQRTYVNKLLSSIYNPPTYENDVAIILKQQAEKIKQACNASLKNKTDDATINHIKAITSMISQWEGNKPTI
ncbi:zinc-dependent metalloprotease [Mucilaginibacter terrae]|uniref:DUF5117 domain-containing protein n=1 Tax=Mucilaginibacter terrae TaxID=1955052 RepID=A0ABU3GR37_9SPHI|nr:zinc-dependent metalloprotease [Mucilaginibacter terrae]MDT3402243.1 hypothetical protein [Mucilaginibacter terrae]